MTTQLSSIVVQTQSGAIAETPARAALRVLGVSAGSLALLLSLIALIG